MIGGFAKKTTRRLNCSDWSDPKPFESRFYGSYSLLWAVNVQSHGLNIFAQYSSVDISEHAIISAGGESELGS